MIGLSTWLVESGLKGSDVCINPGSEAAIDYTVNESSESACYK